MDLIQHKRVQPGPVSINQEESKALYDEIKETRDERERKANQELIKKYGNPRLKNDNPYDILDAFNVEMNLPEIGKELINIISYIRKC